MLLICSNHTPQELKSKFYDFPPIIKNVRILPFDIGEYMQLSQENKVSWASERVYTLPGRQIWFRSVIVTLQEKSFVQT